MESGYEDLQTGLVIFFLWIVTWSLFFFSTRQEGEGPPLTRPHTLFSALTIAVFLSVGIFYWMLGSGLGSMREELKGLAPVIISIGSCTLLGGQWLMVAARRALYKLSNIEVLFRVSSLKVVSGPYRLLRHPMYVGLVSALVGSSLVYMNFLSLGYIALGILPLLYLRSQLENTAS